jgi:hypothetical protein
MRTKIPMLLLATALPAQADAVEKLDLKVLYAGVKDHPRTEQWRAFLTGHTRSVAIADVTTLADGDGKDADVVILDCPDPLVRNAAGSVDRISVPRPKGVTVAFDRPTIVVGGMTLHTDHLQLKSNWL